MEERSETELLGLSDEATDNIDVPDDENDEPDFEPEPKKSRQEHHFTFCNVTWSSTAPEKEPLRETYLPLPADKAKNVTKPLDAWSLLFSQDILEKIVQHTNTEIKRKNKSKRSDTNILEIKALLGLLYFGGITKDNRLNREELWSSQFGNNLYKCVMAQSRFKFLLGILHFEDPDISTKQEIDDKNNQLASIKFIWDVFIANCAKYYSPSTNCTIDSTYLEFRGKFKGLMYIPMSRNKYGIKVTCLNDAETSYMINAEPYVGPVRTTESESEPSYYIRKLSEPVHNTKRNITCDDWFTSVEIVQKMKEEYSLTMVGAFGKKEIEDLSSSYMDTASTGNTHFAYANDNTLVSYFPKRNKVALLLSSLHKTGEIDEESGKPEIVSFYDSTKGGTKIFDKLCQNYSAARKAIRWSLRLFFAMLDQAGVNSAILYNLRAANLSLNHRDFLKELAYTLIKPYLEFKLGISTLQRHVRAALLHEMPDYQEDVSQEKSNNKLKTYHKCILCPKGRKHYCNSCCIICDKPVCLDHLVYYCKPCFNL